MIVRKVNRFIEREHLLSPKDKLLVALSGGADSVALLHVLAALGYELEAAHCNFHLRGEESNRDESFVRVLCKRLRIRLHVTSFDTYRHAETRKISIEMAARELRYEWFEQLRSRYGAQYIAVAHHQDDSVETLLLNLIRGTGIVGLRGIRPRNGAVVRPLLCVSRCEILDYLQQMDETYVTDSTNTDETFMRNKIRLSLLPLLEELNPSVRAGLLQTAANLTEAEAVYRAAIQEARIRVFTPDEVSDEILCPGTLSVSRLQHEPSPGALLYEILSPYGFTSSQIHDIGRAMDSEPGRFFTAGEWVLLKDREAFLLYKKGESTKEPVPSLEVEELIRDASFRLPRDPSVACVDADKITGSFGLRHWKEGDWFVPLGMKGRKLLSDFLTDRKKSLRDKQQQWVLTDGDQIVWVVGERLDDRYRVTEHTRRVYLLKTN